MRKIIIEIKIFLYQNDLIKVIINNKLLRFETNLLMNFDEDVNFFSKNHADFLILTKLHFLKNVTYFVILGKK